MCYIFLDVEKHNDGEHNMIMDTYVCIWMNNFRIVFMHDAVTAKETSYVIDYFLKNLNLFE